MIFLMEIISTCNHVNYFIGIWILFYIWTAFKGSSYIQLCNGNVTCAFYIIISVVCCTVSIIIHNSSFWNSEEFVNWPKLNWFRWTWLILSHIWGQWASIVYWLWCCDWWGLHLVYWGPPGHASLPCKISVVSRCLPRAKLSAPRAELCEHRHTCLSPDTLVCLNPC